MNKIVIGEIDFSNTESYSIPLKKCKVEVRDENISDEYRYIKDDFIPHFHIVDEEQDFDRAICIYDRCSYYLEDKYDKEKDDIIRNFLSLEQEIFLDKWMSENNNWSNIVKAWKELNPNFIYRELYMINGTKPDYSNMLLHDEKYVEIGIIDFGGNIGKCSIRVGHYQGKIPHFHIVALNGSLYCGVRIYDNHFYSHKGQHTDTLTKEQCEILDKWLDTYEFHYLGENENLHSIIPMWDIISYSWKMENYKSKFRKKMMCKTKPNYSEMNEFLETVK